jgi:hypothetical protein
MHNIHYPNDPRNVRQVASRHPPEVAAPPEHVQAFDTESSLRRQDLV